MNKPIIILSTIILIAFFLFYMCTFQVRSTQVAVLKTLGKFEEDDIKREPRLYFKWPWPFQSYVLTDTRTRIMEDAYEETQTKDSQNIMVTTYTTWRVENPYLYHIAVGDELDAEEKLKQRIQTEKKSVVAKFNLSEFVNVDTEKFKFDEIEEMMLERIAPAVLTDYGIKVTDMGIRKLSFPQAVTEQVFDRMKKNEEKTAARYRTEGQARAQGIRAEASEISNKILDVANRLARNIENEAQVEVSEYYKRFEENVELRLFLDRLNASKEVLKERTTLIFDHIIAPFGMPDLKRLLDTEFESFTRK